MNQEPLVYIVVANFNGVNHLKYSIPSLLGLDYDNYDLLVVDNGSSDCSLNYLKKISHKIKLIELGENRFWGGANNIAIAEALKNGAEYILLANTDLMVDKRLLKYGIAQMISKPTIAILGFDTVGEYTAAPVQQFYFKSSAWHTPKIACEKHVGGCLMLIRAALFKKIGLFDEGYRFYGEEDDLERRAIWAGYKIARINLPAWHKGEGTISSTVGFNKSRLAFYSQIRFYLKERSFFKAVLGLIKLINISCNPFFKIKPGFSHHARLRPSNFQANILLFCQALIDNIKNIKEVRNTAQCDLSRISSNK